MQNDCEEEVEDGFEPEEINGASQLEDPGNAIAVDVRDRDDFYHQEQHREAGGGDTG